MALRRVLPSRANSEKTPDGAATAITEPQATSKPAAAAPKTPAANPFGDAVLPEPVTPLVVETNAFAAAATSAFSTLPTVSASTSGRVLEDSFIKPAATLPEPAAEPVKLPEPQPEPAKTPEPEFTAPAWQTPAPAPVAESAPAETLPPVITPAPEPEFVAPAWAAPVVPEPAPAPEPVKLPEPQPEPAKTPEPEFTAPAWQAPAPVAAPVAEPAPVAITPEPQPEPAPVQAAPMPQPAPVVEVQPAPAPKAPEPAPQPAPVVSRPAQNQEPSRPDNAQIRRRVREKRPRDFNAMGAPENAQAERPQPMTAFAPSVPVDTRPLDKVNEDLIATGIMAGPEADSLTGSLPSGVAEMVFVPQPEPASQPVAAPQPVMVPVPVAVPVPAQPKAEPVVAQPAPQSPKPAELPPERPAYVPASVPFTPSVQAPAAPLPPVSSPSVPINLSNTLAPSVILPPPQSDLPWTQAQSAAEWEIETPATPGWSPETGHDSASGSTVSHMPQPADLYKPVGTAGSSPLPPLGGSHSGSGIGGGIPPRSGGNYTPELPGQRRKSSGGAPWTLIIIAAVAVAGGGAWYLRSNGSGHAEQQLANLTTPATPAAVSQTEILQPPHTENASFYTPPVPADTTSSSAVVNFADVPADQANQPIVATGKEEIPQSFFGKLGTEIEKARARKEAGLPVDASGTTPAPTDTAAAGTAYTPEKFQQEMAAYRSALAQSPNPAALKPAAFLKDPDGYMDGKSQTPAATPVATTGADGAAMASGALLPPPAASAGAALPPPELYTNNPKHLPVVAEPIANAPQRVRTLADFPDIEPYAPEKEKVEIPKNLKPKMAATDFPSLEVLSFVPDKGIVAFADGREGVLLIGESINGWTLVGVSPDHAEFKTGEKSYQVTADN